MLLPLRYNDDSCFVAVTFLSAEKTFDVASSFMLISFIVCKQTGKHNNFFKVLYVHVPKTKHGFVFKYLLTSVPF